MHSFIGYHLLADHSHPLRTDTLAFSTMSGALMVAILPGDYFFIHIKSPQAKCIPTSNTVMNVLKMVA
jgi:hypothetical protein